jgi:O-antigen ligase
VVGFLLLLSSLNLPEISPRFSDVQLTAGAAGRAGTVSDSMRIVRDFPLFGVGLDGFQYIFPVYRSYGGWLLTHVHNDYVELAVEAGVPALVFALLLIGILYVRAVSSFRKPRKTRTLLWGFLVATTALLIHSSVDFNLHIPANALVFALLLGGVARLSRDPEFRVASPRRASLLAIAVLLCVVAAAHWPLMRADLEFRRLIPDSTLRDSRPMATATALVPAAALTRLAAAAPEHPFIQSEAGRALLRQLRETEPKGDPSSALRQAVHYFAAAARGIPPWAEAHLSLGLSAATGATGLTLADVQDALSRAQRLDPRDRDTSRAIARARRALLRGNGA